jgi:hypothetical protein
MLVLTTIVVYTHITNDKNRSNGTSFSNQKFFSPTTQENESKLEHNAHKTIKNINDLFTYNTRESKLEHNAHNTIKNVNSL